MKFGIYLIQRKIVLVLAVKYYLIKSLGDILRYILSPYSTKKRVGVGSSLRHLAQRPDARHPTQPIFHWKWGLRLLPNAKKYTQKKRNVHGQRKKLASPNARYTNMLVFLALGDAKVLSFALGDAKVTDAR